MEQCYLNYPRSQSSVNSNHEVGPKKKKPKEMPTDCPCILGCTNCIKELSEASNLIIYLVSHEWEEWVRNDIARSPVLGDKLLFRHVDREVPCRVVKITKGKDHPNIPKYVNHPGLVLYTIRWPPSETDLKQGEKMQIRHCPRDYLRFRRRKFPRSWAVWLVDHLNLVEGGVAEVSFRRNFMLKKLRALSMTNTDGDHDGEDGSIRKINTSNNCRFVFVPKPW